MAQRVIHGQEIKIGWGKNDSVGNTNPVTASTSQRPAVTSDSEVCVYIKKLIFYVVVTNT
jgi:hypothetical protein